MKRDWWVYSTAIANGSILVQCHKTGAYGHIPNPSSREWNKAFYAPSNPYRWKESERVVVDEPSKDSA